MLDEVTERAGHAVADLAGWTTQRRRRRGPGEDPWEPRASVEFWREALRPLG